MSNPHPGPPPQPGPAPQPGPPPQPQPNGPWNGPASGPHPGAPYGGPLPGPNPGGPMSGLNPGGPMPGQGYSGPTPGWAAPPPPTPAASSDKVRLAAQILCPVLVIVGLSIPQHGSVGWTDYTLWAVFAAVMALAQLITLTSDRDPAQSSTIRMIATGGLVAYWVVIVLPSIASNAGFLQTLGVGCAVISAWLSSSRR